MAQVKTKRREKPNANIKVVKLAPHLGAEICGVDLSQPMDDVTFAAIRSAFVEHEVIVFRDQEIDAIQQIAFAERFGPLSVHPFSPHDEDRPELIIFDNKPDNEPFGTDRWHSDETFREIPPMATMLCAKIVPDVGGDTMFASMTAAYDSLSGPIQALVDKLEAVHDLVIFRETFSDDEEGALIRHRMEKKFPNPIHPVVRIHPETGRKAIFVNPQFTIRIKGLKERESRALLDMLYDLPKIPELQYRHHWAPNTLICWDNRSVQHYAPNDYMPQRRFIERVTMAGDRPFGFTGPTYNVKNDAHAEPKKLGNHAPLSEEKLEN